MILRGSHLLLVALLTASWGAPARAARSPDLLALGRHYYAAGELGAAVRVFRTLVGEAPGVAEYYLWLGRAYGRLAEHSSWGEALELAVKSRRALERAVVLDGSNRFALEDLRRFYLQAPGFLGGSARKAARLADRLRRLGYPVRPERVRRADTARPG